MALIDTTCRLSNACMCKIAVRNTGHAESTWCSSKYLPTFKPLGCHEANHTLHHSRRAYLPSLIPGRSRPALEGSNYHLLCNTGYTPHLHTPLHVAKAALPPKFSSLASPPPSQNLLLCPGALLVITCRFPGIFFTQGTLLTCHPPPCCKTCSSTQGHCLVTICRFLGGSLT
uniref:Uncharacterized protein n=1 Tax=Dunaliella tertiolecta TaxID=3047 RepID=A0A7S3QRZ9_DUNTE|eukprot:1160693-Pelagomonas_calceolata.AAC.6